jgi:hypothetical protein
MLDYEAAEPSNLDAIPLRQRVHHGIENRVDDDF